MLRWLRENAGSLFLSLVLSLAIWVVAVRQQNPIEQREYPNSLPVVIRGIGPGLVISGNYTHEVRVSLRAPRSTWNNLTPDDISVVADLTDLPPGTHTVMLVVEMPRLQAVNAQAEPTQIIVTLEEQREREVPVQVTLVGEPAIGFGVGETVVEPGSVILSGPLSLVDRVSEVSAEVDVSDLRETIQTDLTVGVLDSEGNPVTGLEVKPAQIGVTVPIESLPNFKEVAVIVNHEGTAPAFGYYVSGINVTPVSVTVQGPPDVINEMPGFVRTAPVDLTGLRDSFARTVGLVLPEGVLPVGSPTVQVDVKIETFKGSLAVRRPLEMMGLGEGLEAVLSPDAVDMILSGSLAVLDQLTQTDVRVVLDLTGLTAGTYQVEPEVVTLPEGITSESLLPATIEVQIQAASSTP